MKKIVMKFVYAYQGISYGLKNDRSIRLQCCLAVIAIMVSIVLKFTINELAIVLGFCGLVISLEFINSAIEGIMDLYHPEIDDKVKHIKDVAAASVLVASLFALCVGILFVLKHI